MRRHASFSKANKTSIPITDPATHRISIIHSIPLSTDFPCGPPDSLPVMNIREGERENTIYDESLVRENLRNTDDGTRDFFYYRITDYIYRGR